MPSDPCDRRETQLSARAVARRRNRGRGAHRSHWAEPSRPSPGGIRSDLQRQGHDRVTPRLAENAARVLAKPRSSSMPTDLAASTSPMAIGRVNGGRRTATGDPIRVGKRLP